MSSFITCTNLVISCFLLQKTVASKAFPIVFILNSLIQACTLVGFEWQVNSIVGHKPVILFLAFTNDQVAIKCAVYMYVVNASVYRYPLPHWSHVHSKKPSCTWLKYAEFHTRLKCSIAFLLFVISHRYLLSILYICFLMGNTYFVRTRYDLRRTCALSATLGFC